MARCRGRDRSDSGMGVLVQQRQTPLRLREYPPGRIRERLANGTGPHYNQSGSQSIVASNKPGAAHLAVLALQLGGHRRAQPVTVGLRRLAVIARLAVAPVLGRR